MEPLHVLEVINYCRYGDWISLGYYSWISFLDPEYLSTSKKVMIFDEPSKFPTAWIYIAYYCSMSTITMILAVFIETITTTATLILNIRLVWKDGYLANQHFLHTIITRSTWLEPNQEQPFITDITVGCYYWFDSKVLPALFISLPWSLANRTPHPPQFTSSTVLPTHPHLGTILSNCQSTFTMAHKFNNMFREDHQVTAWLQCIQGRHVCA